MSADERPCDPILPAPLREMDPSLAVATELLAERRRQIYEEGYTPKHDDRFGPEAFAHAAAAYATAEDVVGGSVLWPDEFDGDAFKPKDLRRNLVRAGALILAAIERLDRMAAAAKQEEAEK